MDAQLHINSFKRPTTYSLNAWNTLKRKALSIWEAHLQGEKWDEQIDITCKESYLMLVDADGKLIIKDNDLLHWVHNRHNLEWIRNLEQIALQAAKSKNYERALLYFNKALTIRPDSYVNLYRRAIVKQKLYHYKGALDDYNTAIRLEPNNEMLYIKRAGLYSILDMDQRAMDDLNKAIKLDPGSAEAYKQRGLLRHAIGDKAGARMDLEKANQLVPRQFNYLPESGKDKRAA